MKLSKQERIAVLVIAVIIILGLGIFLFIVPKFEAIGTSSAALINKQTELQETIDRAATKDQLGEDVKKAYDEGRDIADMFFQEMKPYQADNEIREFLQYCSDSGIKVAVDSLQISEPSVSTLGVSFATEPEVTYDLKTYATQGREMSEEELAEQNRTQIMQAALSTAQTVGSIEVSFTATVLTDEDMLKFIDAINDYNKQEDGKTTRKAMRLSNGFTFTDSEVEAKYAEYVADLTTKALNDGNKQLAKDTGKKVSGTDDKNTTADNNTENADNTNNNKDNEDVTTFEQNTRQVTVTIVMYSIERMADPTEQLSAQNAQ